MEASMNKIFEKFTDKEVCACVCVCLVAYELNL